jgi:hypothetical protein
LKWSANLEQFKLLTRFQTITEYSNFVTIFNHITHKKCTKITKKIVTRNE